MQDDKPKLIQSLKMELTQSLQMELTQSLQMELTQFLWIKLTQSQIIKLTQPLQLVRLPLRLLLKWQLINLLTRLMPRLPSMRRTPGQLDPEPSSILLSPLPRSSPQSGPVESSLQIMDMSWSLVLISRPVAGGCIVLR